MQKKLEWLFFDFDGTLVDSIHIMFQVYLNFLQRFNIKGSTQEFNEMNGISLIEIIQLIKKRYFLSVLQDELLTLYKNDIYKAYQHVNPHLHAHKVLQTLYSSGYKLTLVTASFPEVVNAFIEKQNWKQFFLQYVFGDEVVKAKPDPTIYNLALQKTNASRHEIIVIEDSVNGVLAAKALNLYVCGFAHHHSQRDLLNAGANSVISNLANIIDVIKL